MRRFLCAVLSAWFSASAASAAQPLFDPRETVAVVAGVLEWENKGFESFPKARRKDAELDAALAKLGVKRRTLLLDRKATKTAILEAVRAAVAASGPETTLIFYYAGHGVKGPDGGIAFAGYEMHPWKAESGLRLSELSELFVHGGQRLFRGRRVILLADCCHSGGLSETARVLASVGIDAVALTSADASNASTGNWTFTQTLLDALRGRPACDRDRDGVVALSELAEEARESMKYREGQRYGYANHGVPADAVVAASAPDGSPEPEPRWALATRGGRDAVARVLAVEGGRARVAFYDYSDETVAWVSRSALKTPRFEPYPAGSRLSVDWDGQLYAAEVLRAEDGLHFVTYPGWGHEWDEWVGPPRIRGVLEAGENPARPRF